MSALLLPALAAGSSGQGALYVDDVFSTYLYTGNDSTQTINNGIDLAGKGGLVWLKHRDASANHGLIDTVRGGSSVLNSNTTLAAASSAVVNSFNSNGFQLGTAGWNGTGLTLVSWTFRRAPKFFDVVTYTGNSVTGRQIAHSLGVQAGFVTVKATSTTGDWNSYHRSATGDLKLNTTDAQTASRAIITAADASTFAVSGAANTNGVSYVAYLWAHDPSADGIVQCGSYTGNGSAVGPVVTLGLEPQYLMIKNVSETAANWQIIDSMRGMTTGPADANKQLVANLGNAEADVNFVIPTATGFQVTSTSRTVNASGATYIYLAIRRPNKPPTSGAQVYNASVNIVDSAGTVIGNIGFNADAAITTKINSTSGHLISNRLTGAYYLTTDTTEAQNGPVDIAWDFNNAVKQEPWSGGTFHISHFFRRATGFFDVVCGTGTGVAHAITHNLTKAPELIIRKSRSAATQWEVWHSALAATEKLVLNSNAAKATDATAWNSALPTATQFTVGTGANVNANAATFVTYLFATLAGISKVGSYTGNGSSQTIDCGFSTGARFVLIKRTDAAGDWYVWDTARGIVAANDPHLSLNTTAAEVTTDDSIDPASVGFIVNQNAATNINVNGGSYIFLAIA